MTENTKLNSKLLIQIQKPGVEWHARRDLNPRPLDSKSTALSTELRAHHDNWCDQIVPIYFTIMIT